MHQPVRPTFNRAAEHNQRWLPTMCWDPETRQPAYFHFGHVANVCLNDALRTYRVARIQEAIRKCSRR